MFQKGRRFCRKLPEPRPPLRDLNFSFTGSNVLARPRRCRSRSNRTEGLQMLIEAALNGGRTRAEHPAIPCTPRELAVAAAESVAAGARAIHFHVRNRDGRESVDADDVAAAVTAVRAAIPGVTFGVSTGAWILSDPKARHEAVARWKIFPDFASVNFKEDGAKQLTELLLSRGIGIEIGLSDVHGTELFVASRLAAKCLRVLIEPMEEAVVRAMWMVDSIETVLARGRVTLPRVLHGMDATAWPILDEAVARSYDTRVGFEDVLAMPDGTIAASNAALVAEAARRAEHHGRHRKSSRA